MFGMEAEMMQGLVSLLYCLGSWNDARTCVIVSLSWLIRSDAQAACLRSTIAFLCDGGLYGG